MGSGTTRPIGPSPTLDEETTVRLMMPVYYIDDIVLPSDIALAEHSWSAIVNDTSEKFQQLKHNNSCSSPSCLSWFYVIFYDRLFDVHPLSRQLFTNTLNNQGKFLVMMISSCLKQLDNSNQFQSSMLALAERHCERGVRANEYGIVGDVLFWSLRQVLGGGYTAEVEHAWIKIYSHMLKFIVPVAIHFEKQVGSDLPKRSYGLLRASSDHPS
jgi:hemoglobin-like flavoprotein